MNMDEKYDRHPTSSELAQKWCVEEGHRWRFMETRLYNEAQQVYLAYFFCEKCFTMVERDLNKAIHIK
jgi:hypothetical protein